MLKVAGWIISDSAVDDWRRAHPELDQRHIGLTTTTNAIGIVEERIYEGLEPLPVSDDAFICTNWPKMTKTARGNTVCMLVRRMNFNAKDETWENFTPILQKPGDEEIFDALESDGLKLGEWVTVPDPFESEWPFRRRYLGASCPPEPVYKGYKTGLKLAMY